MEKVKNMGEGPLAFKDDDGNRYEIKAGETIECNYKKSGDHRLVIEPLEKKSKKKKEVKDGSH